MAGFKRLLVLAVFLSGASDARAGQMLVNSAGESGELTAFTVAEAYQSWAWDEAQGAFGYNGSWTYLVPTHNPGVYYCASSAGDTSGSVGVRFSAVWGATFLSDVGGSANVIATGVGVVVGAAPSPSPSPSGSADASAVAVYRLLGFACWWLVVVTWKHFST